MNIVYLIGNGFDINLGLKTRFTDFYQYYLQQDSKSPIINQFKNELSSSIDKWSDLEVVLGEYAKNFTNETLNEFMSLIYDIQDNLAVYIKKQVPNIKLSESMEQKLSTELFSPNMYFNKHDTAKFLDYKKNYNNLCNHMVDVINFNYSPTFERLFSYKNKSKVIGSHNIYNNNNNITYKNILNSVTHIHGTTEENMILGVNDISQINNEDIRKSKLIQALLIKPETNKYTGTSRDLHCMDKINQANIICIFGMSLGKTDKIWWQAIVNRLLTSSACLIIFDAKKRISRLRKYMEGLAKDEITNKLLSFSDINEDKKSAVLNRIFVYFNSEIFCIPNINESKYPMLQNNTKNVEDISS